MIGVRVMALMVLLIACASRLAAQVSVRGGAVAGRAEHCVAAGALVTSSGTLLGGTVAVAVGQRFEIQGEAIGGDLLTPSSPGLDDHKIAEADLIAGVKVRPWLALQTGFSARNFSNALARQHWTTWRIGAEARIPLGFDEVTSMVRGYWMPVVSISGLSRADVAIAAAVGMEWRRHRFGVTALYTFERYDFAAETGGQRLEDLSMLRLGLSVAWQLRPRKLH